MLRLCMLLCFLVLTVDLGAVASARVGARRTFSVTSLNVAWFGTNGGISRGAETRTQSLRRHLLKNGLLADVMAFDEVINIPLLRDEVLAGEYACQTYFRESRMHQHVVVCHKSSEFRFEKAYDDDNYELESVDINRSLRPAVHGILTTLDGEELLHVIAVHLKAMPGQSAMRRRQVGKIVDYLEGNDPSIPRLVVGDFNTFGSDPQNMERQFRTVGMTELKFPEPYSWASKKESFPPAKLDRLWLSEELVPRVTSAHIVGPCSSNDLDAIAAYNEAVSDHCALHVEFRR